MGRAQSADIADHAESREKDDIERVAPFAGLSVWFQPTMVRR